MGYNLLINGVYWGYNPLILTIDPNFLGHPSKISFIGGMPGGDKLDQLHLHPNHLKDRFFFHGENHTVDGSEIR